MNRYKAINTSHIEILFYETIKYINKTQVNEWNRIYVKAVTKKELSGS